MSNKFDAKEINDQIDKLKPNLEIALTDLQGVGNSVTAILNNGEFTGEFATNVKSYYSEVHGKAIEVLHTLIDAVNTAGDKLKQNAQTVDSDGNAKIVTDYLLNEQTRDMQSVQEAYTHHKSAIQAQVSSIGDIVGISMPSENVGDATEQAKRELKNIAQKVDDFANQSVVDEITSLLGSLDSLMGYMDGCQTAGGPGKYQAGDLGKQPFYADIDKNVEHVESENIKTDLEKLPDTGNEQDYNAWVIHMFNKYGDKIFDKIDKKMKDPKFLIGKAKTLVKFIDGKLWLGNREIKVDELSKVWLKEKGKSEFLNGRKLYDGRYDEFTKLGKDSEEYLTKYKNFANVNSALNPLEKLNRAHKAGLNGMNPLSDFKSWGEVGALGKVGKGLGAAGTILTVGGNANKYFHDGIQGTDVADFATDTAVDIGAGMGAAYAGAAVGSFFLPPLGTVVGAAAGLIVTGALNLQFGNPPKSTIDHAKDGFKNITHGVGNFVGSLTKMHFW